MRLSFAGLLVVIALLIPRAGHAQWAADLYPGARVDAAPAVRVDRALPAVHIGVQPEGEQRPAGVLAFGGLLGGAAGMAAGMYLGARVDAAPADGCGEFCIESGIIYGALLGEVLGIALGTHLANDRRGSFPLDMLASAGILTAGLLVALEDANILLVIPVAQILGTVAVERRTQRVP